MVNGGLVQSQSPRIIQPLQNGGSNDSLVYAAGQTVGFVARLAGLILLLILLIAASVVWIWLYSFRSGWKFWDWLHKSENTGSVAPTLIYGLIVLFVSPLIFFAEWSQQFIQRWLNITVFPDIDLRQIVEDQLGTSLGDNFPFFRK